MRRWLRDLLRVALGAVIALGVVGYLLAGPVGFENGFRLALVLTGLAAPATLFAVVLSRDHEGPSWLPIRDE